MIDDVLEKKSPTYSNRVRFNPWGFWTPMPTVMPPSPPVLHFTQTGDGLLTGPPGTGGGVTSVTITHIGPVLALSFAFGS